jgi:hypothetical protein
LAAAIAWKQTVNSADELPLLFTSDISNGFSSAPDTVDLNNVTTVDVAMSNGNIFVVWEDEGSGTIKFREGSYLITTATHQKCRPKGSSCFTKPCEGFSVGYFRRFRLDNAAISIQNNLGENLYNSKVFEPEERIQIDVSFLKPEFIF